MIKDYYCIIECHPEKANVVADALSRRPESSLSHMRSGYLPLLVDLRALGVILEAEDLGALLATFHVRPLLVDQIWASDEYLKYSFYPYDLVSFSSFFMLNKFPNALKVHTYDQVIHLMELCKIGGKTTMEAATVF